MIVQVYKYDGNFTRSIARAHLVAEVEVDEFPEDQIAFAQEYGGDLIEVVDGVAA